MNLKKLYNDKIEIFSEVKFRENFKKPGNECKHRTIKCRTIRCLSQKFNFKSPNGKHFVFLLTDRVFTYFNLPSTFTWKTTFLKVHITLTFPIFCASYESVKFIQLCRGRWKKLFEGGDKYIYIYTHCKGDCIIIICTLKK